MSEGGKGREGWVRVEWSTSYLLTGNAESGTLHQSGCIDMI
jgi:hypothetical protein